MIARDVMTTDVVSVGPGMPTERIGRLLLQNNISAAPVIDASGALVGMLSEGDLIGRDEAAHTARRDWWLTLPADGEQLSESFLATLRAPARTASQVKAGGQHRRDH